MENKAKHQLYVKKPTSLLKGIKIEGQGIIHSKIRKESDLLSFKIKNIMNSIDRELKKKKYNVVLPKVMITEKPVHKKNTHYNTENRLIFVSKQFLKNEKEENVLLNMLKNISEYLYDSNDIKLNDIRLVFDYLNKNKQSLKKNISGIYLNIPDYKYGRGICLPKVNLNNFKDFLVTTFSFYIQDIFPKTTENEELDKIVSAIKMSYSK
jgi:hypothetical protein